MEKELIFSREEYRLRVRETKTSEQNLVVHQETKYHERKERIHLWTGKISERRNIITYFVYYSV